MSKKKSKKRARRENRRTLAAVAGAVGVAVLALFGRRHIGSLADSVGVGGRDRPAGEAL